MSYDQPDLKDGYLRIANPIQDALCKIKIPGEARQVLDYILRKTYGWQEKLAPISLREFAEGTTLKIRSVRRGIEKLKGMNLIIIHKAADSRKFSYGLNKYHQRWLSCADMRTPLCARMRTPMTQNAHADIHRMRTPISDNGHRDKALLDPKDTLKDTS